MKSVVRSMFGAVSVAGLAWVSFSAQGCKRPGLLEACMAACECARDAPCAADDEGVEICMMYGEAEREGAEEKGCLVEFDDWTACTATEYDCPTTNDTCKEEVDALQSCKAKAEAE